MDDIVIPMLTQYSYQDYTRTLTKITSVLCTEYCSTQTGVPAYSHRGTVTSMKCFYPSCILGRLFYSNKTFIWHKIHRFLCNTC